MYETMLKGLSTAQLREIKNIIEVGVVSKSEVDNADDATKNNDDAKTVLETNLASAKEEIMDLEKKVEALEAEVQDYKDKEQSWASEKTEIETSKTEQASQIESLTNELTELRTEVEGLREFKKETEEAAERAEKLKVIKSQLEEAGLEADLEDEAESTYWLGMTEEVLKKTIAKMGEIKVGSAASASKINVPPVSSDDTESAIEIARAGLRERKGERK